MGLDLVAGPARQLGDADADVEVREVGHAAARHADRVMMVVSSAGDVRVVAARQVDPLDDALLLEEGERPEHRRASHRDPVLTGGVQEVGGSERPGLPVDERGQPPARLREARPGLVESIRGVHDG